MFIIGSITKYEYLLATGKIPFISKQGFPLQMDICQGYGAMFFGKLPSHPFGKKYAYVYEIGGNRTLTLDEWRPEIKQYFEQAKTKYRLPYRYRFGWLFILLGTLLLIVLSFVGLFIYLLYFARK